MKLIIKNADDSRKKIEIEDQLILSSLKFTKISINDSSGQTLSFSTDDIILVENEDGKYDFEVEAEVKKENRLNEFFEWLNTIGFRKLDEKAQIILVSITALLTIFIFACLYLSVREFPEPIIFWEYIGKHIQGVVGWGLFVMFFAIYMSFVRIGYNKSQFSTNYIAIIFLVMSLIAPLTWSIISKKPEVLVNSNSDTKNIEYLEYLFSNIKTLFPAILGIIPFATLIVRLLGFDLMANIIKEGSKLFNE